MNRAIASRIGTVLLVIVILPLGWLGSSPLGYTKEPTQRDSRWAQPISKPGLPNLHKINDQLYRGAQPEKKGYAELSKLGIKTVICLRDSDPEWNDLKQAKLECIHIPVKTWNPTNDQVVQFLQIVTDPSKQPIFVHCRHGADRTGTMCALYRIAVEGWSKNDALREMTKGGFGFHSLWTNLIEFIEKIDVPAIKEKAGIK